MWTCGFVFSITVSLVIASELHNDDGWIPVNSDVVYNQIKHGIRTIQHTKADSFQVLNTGELLETFAASPEFKDLKTKQDIKDIDEFSNRELAVDYDNFKDMPGLQYEFNFLPVTPPINENVQTDVTLRRSKKLAGIDSQVLLNYIVPPKDDKPKNFLKNIEEKKFAENNTHTYKVTEDISTEDEMQEESKANEKGYKYIKPIKLNFTNDLSTYLSKYNINGDDNIQNYALSRRLKAESRVIQDHRHKPFMFQIPVRYNSLNHLPVDPLLAVFLSNYGHYLQGQYGISNNYNNLYGYLASNNIHNNRPFGFYKLFSDTDSSNRLHYIK